MKEVVQIKIEMKERTKYIWVILLGMVLTMQSCLDTVIVDDPDPFQGEGMVPIALDLSGIVRTYADGTDYGSVTDTAGSDIENRVDDIIVYIFDHSFTCEKILQGSTAPVGPEMVKIGTKHFITVVNAQANVSTLYPIPFANPSSVSYPALRQKLSDALSAVPASPFLMVGEKLYVPVTDQRPYTNPNKITIDVERAVAKVTMSFTKSALAASHNITVQKVTMYNGANKVYLLDKPATNDITYTLTDVRSTFTPIVVDNSPTYIAFPDSFYTYAADCGKDTSKAVRFEIEATINSPANVRTAKFFLAKYIAGSDTVYDIRRNYWYHVNVNMKDPGMDSVYVTIHACPWNVVEPIEKIEGHGAEISLPTPFKLVKNYLASDTIYNGIPNPDILAIDLHSKGASWIDMKVTNETEWELKLQDASHRNQGVLVSLDTGKTWINLSVYPVRGVGNDVPQRVYIYRFYNETNEPQYGPSLYMELNGQYYRDFVIQPRDTIPIPTNCYILRPRQTGNWPINETRAYIPLSGVYRVWEDYFYENGKAIPDGNITSTVLWDDNPAGNVVDNVSVINLNKRDSAYIYVEAGLPGNAVVAMHVQTPSGDSIYWSFHIWVTEYNPYEAAGQKLYSSFSSTNAFIPQTNAFMDRNLGALTNMYDSDGRARGLFYQFGRKDPFPGAFPAGLAWTNATYPSISSTAPVPAASGAVRPLTAIQTSIKYPLTFYTRTGATSWSLSEEDRNLWFSNGGNKTPYDPCPEGWRIPKVIEVAGPSSTNPWLGEISDPLLSPITDYYKENGFFHPLVGYYPLSGYVNYSTGAGVAATTTQSYLWSSASIPANMNVNMGLLIQNTGSSQSMGMVQIEKSYGASVRCVVDVNYLKEKGRLGLFGNSTDNLLSELGP